jgi:hypothetical protein
MNCSTLRRLRLASEVIDFNNGGGATARRRGRRLHDDRANQRHAGDEPRRRARVQSRTQRHALPIVGPPWGSPGEGLAGPPAHMIALQASHSNRSASRSLASAAALLIALAGQFSSLAFAQERLPVERPPGSRAAICSASSDKGLCKVFASSIGARIQTSRSSFVARIVGIALGWIRSTVAFPPPHGQLALGAGPSCTGASSPWSSSRRNHSRPTTCGLRPCILCI